MHFKDGRSLLIKCTFHIENHRANKEKQTTDHEGSEEITQEQQCIPKGMSLCIPHFLSQFMSDLLVF